jgi:hypothetical protein
VTEERGGESGGDGGGDQGSDKKRADGEGGTPGGGMHAGGRRERMSRDASPINWLLFLCLAAMAP